MRRRSYAVWWNDGDGPRRAGKLQVGKLHLLLSGKGAGRLAVPLEEIASSEHARGELLVRRRRGGDLIRIGSLDAPGALRELSNLLAS
jgi:hypothetical protein